MSPNTYSPLHRQFYYPFVSSSLVSTTLVSRTLPLPKMRRRLAHSMRPSTNQYWTPKTISTSKNISPSLHLYVLLKNIQHFLLCSGRSYIRMFPPVFFTPPYIKQKVCKAFQGGKLSCPTITVLNIKIYPFHPASHTKITQWAKTTKIIQRLGESQR